jgi:N6-adenosine-specific RNA methylase IME4
MVIKIKSDYIDYLKTATEKDFAIVDPPWDYNDKENPAISNNLTYSRWDNVQGLNTLFSLLNTKYLFLWCTNSMIEEVFKVNFNNYIYKTIITWVKETPHKKLHYGLGNTYRNCTEQLLVFSNKKEKPLRSSLRNCYIDTGWFKEVSLSRTQKPKDFEVCLIKDLVTKGLKQGVYLFSGPNVDVFNSIENLELECVDICVE